MVPYALADLLSIAIPVGGAIAVALIAAITAGRRLERQLTEEGERHRQSLVAEGKRQAARLAHERTLADLADLRALLDKAAVALHLADYVRADVKVGVMQYARKLDEHKPEARASLNESGRALDALKARLRVRLGSGEPVVRAFQGADEALLTMMRRTAYFVDLGNYKPDEVRQEINAASDEFEGHVREFHAAAVEIAGTARDA